MYILNMKVGLLMFLPEKEEPVKQEVPEPSSKPLNYGDFTSLQKFLKSYEAAIVPKVFSSDNSLKSCIVYGDVYDLLEVIEKTIEALMLDKSINLDIYLKQRQPNFIRTMFVARDGSFPNVEESLKKIKEATLRLSEGYALRLSNINLGLYTRRNLDYASIVLSDLDMFYTELYYEYRKPRIGDDSN